jgi:hypothetical protein
VPVKYNFATFLYFFFKFFSSVTGYLAKSGSSLLNIVVMLVACMVLVTMEAELKKMPVMKFS